MQAADQRKLSSSLLLDLSAGFDVVNHEILLQKLSVYGFDGLSISWFDSYLKGRVQTVQVESSFSPYLAVPWGVPQGSILGPLLFILYINELPEVLNCQNGMVSENSVDITEDGTVVVYADDNTPTVSHSDPDILIQKTQALADVTVEWFKKNDMIVSADKTKLLVLGTKANKRIKVEDYNDLEVVIDQRKVSAVKSEKLLGVIINENLTWKSHLYGDEENPGLLRDLQKRIGVLKYVRKFLPDSKFKQMVSGLFISKITYCINVWIGLWGIGGQSTEDVKPTISKEDVNRLQVLQNSVLRLLTRCDRRTPTSTLLNLTGFLSVHQLGAYHTALQLFKTYRAGKPLYHYNRLFKNNHVGSNPRLVRSMATYGSRVDFKLSTCRSSFFYQGAKLWAALPAEIKSSSTEYRFRVLCKEWIKMNIIIRP